jgi:uncharacterized membrane protein HdeD (DUF308 family)
MEKQPEKPATSLNWLWGGALIMLGLLFLANQLFNFDLTGLMIALGFAGVGVIFLAVYLVNHQQWWALIPFYIMEVIAGIILLSTTNLEGEIVAMLIMFAIGLPFLYLYLRNRAHWWALIPAYIMFAIGMFVFLASGRMDDNLLVTYIMFAIALPFFVVFLSNRANWWALIPGGVMAMIGLAFMAGSLVSYVIPGVLIVAGIFLLVRELASGGRRTAPIEPKTGPETDKPQQPPMV